jgi:hypothetical protein
LKYLLIAKAGHLAGLSDRTTLMRTKSADPNKQRSYESNRNYIRRLIFGKFALPYADEFFRWENGDLVALPRANHINSQHMWYHEECNNLKDSEQEDSEIIQ